MFGQDQQRVIQSPQISFAGGINTSVPPDRIADDEAVDIVNFRFDDQDSLLGRVGTVTVLDRISAATISNRITSIYSARYNGGGVRNIYTIGSAIREGAGTDITGGLTLPSNNFWQWKMLGDLAIGVNKATSGNNPVKVPSVGNAAALGGSPPRAKYIEIWNDRVWLSGVGANSNTIYGSVLGDPEDWTTGPGTASGFVQIDIEPDDGDEITGLFAFRGRLFIFKRNRIYTLQTVGGASPADATALAVELYTSGLGCISAYSIQAVLDDVLFLSDGGIASLVASERVGDFTGALLSSKVYDIKRIVKGTFDNEIFAYVVPEHSQYWLMLPREFSFIGEDEVFVLDYRKIQEGKVRWSRYQGAVAGTVMTRDLGNSAASYWIAGRRNTAVTTYSIQAYLPEWGIQSPIYNDNVGGTDGEEAIDLELWTKMFDFGLPFIRKEFERFALALIALYSLLDDPVVTVDYYFDDSLSRTGQWLFTLTEVSGRDNVKLSRKFKYNDVGSRGGNVQFKLSNTELDQSFGISGIAVSYVPLSDKKIMNL